MTRLSIALLIGLGLGAAVSTGAQQPLRPCAASWIAWVYLENEWNPVRGAPTEENCMKLARALKFAGPGKEEVVYTCFPDTFDPRPRR